MELAKVVNEKKFMPKMGISACQVARSFGVGTKVVCHKKSVALLEERQHIK